MSSKEIVVWHLSDGKPGHVNQSIGLIEELKRLVPTHHYTFELKGSWWKDVAAIKHRGSKLPPPDLIVGTGHKTHIPMLRTRKHFGGKCAVIMKPSLPLKWFDYAILPEHDLVDGENVIQTKGNLNKVQPSENLDKTKGLILIGGESKHFYWDSEGVYTQLKLLLQQASDVEWTLTTSRRTPDDFLESISSLSDKIDIVPFEETDSLWVPRMLDSCGLVCVSEDSSSMIYEALTAGGKVLTLSLSCKKENGKMIRALESLYSASLISKVCSITERNKEVFHESKRVAEELMKRLNLA